MIEINMNSMDGVVLMTAGKKIEENIKVTPVASLILPEYNGEYELLVPTVSGVWVFNSDIDSPDFIQTVNFSSDGKTYEKMWAEMSEVYYDDDVAWNSTDWYNEAYRTVDFGTEPQEVSEEFYAWLTANAVKQ